MDGHGGDDGEGDDVVLFVGSGTTGAVAKLVSALHLDRKKSQSRFTRSKNDRLVQQWASVRQLHGRTRFMDVWGPTGLTYGYERR